MTEHDSFEGTSHHMVAPGSLIASRYRLQSCLATGGMGTIWAAADELLGRTVAVKVVRPEYADDPTSRQRLMAEARAAAAVRSPHIVDIYDVGDTADNGDGQIAYIVMPLIEGESLAQILAAGPLPPTATTDLVAQVGEALAAAHDSGVVHRDIKPANLMRDRAGRIVVLDFGIARAADAAALTATGQLLGTARYMSPEQVAGDAAGPASDVYALGVVAYQCLVGSPPFDAGSDVATAIAHRDQPVPTLPAAVPPGLAALVTACLAKDPAERPSAHEVARLAVSLAPSADAGGSTTVMAIPPVGGVAGADAMTAAVPRARATGVPHWLESRRVLGAAAGLVAVIAVIAIIGALTDGPSTATATGSHGRSTTSIRPAAHHSPSGVTVHAREYVGRPYSVAAARLSRLGLTPIAAGSNVAPTTLVAGISPVGKLAKGASVTLILAPADSTTTRQAPAHRAAPHHGPGEKHQKSAMKPKPPKPVPPGHAKKAGPGHGKKG